MKTLAIIQARMGSTRLPGKVLLPLDGMPMILYMLGRIEKCKRIDKIVVAIPRSEENDTLRDALNNYPLRSTTIYSGEEKDVLKRFVITSRIYRPDIIVRLTADCPLHDPSLIDWTIYWINHMSFDVITNTRYRTYPNGLDIETMKDWVLHRLYHESHTKFAREHVTPALEKTRAKIYDFKCVPNYSHLSCTVDTQEDYEKCQRIISLLPEKYNWKDVTNVLLNLEKEQKG